MSQVSIRSSTPATPGCSLSNALGASPATASAGEPVPHATTSPLVRATVLLYGVVCYAIFFGTFLLSFGFVGNLFIPGLDRAATGSGWSGAALAILIDVLLLGLFAVQHSVMARPWFKARLTRYIPEAAERSTYVLLSSVALLLLIALWRPIGGIVWDAPAGAARIALTALMASGWLLVLVTTFLINHFDLFGLRQVWLFARNKPYTNLPFKTPALYSQVRHPLYVGWLIGFWATPTMSSAHLLFAIVTTVYILAAIRWEERDLLDLHGRSYAEYRRRVPMLVPRFRRATEGGA
ncbi:MAG: NnrU family protein [Phycisphaerales bacterium]